MAVAPMRTQGDAQTYEPLPMDTYYMRVREADITLSNYKDKDGSDQYQLMLCWEISRLTAEQQEAEVDESRWVRQWLGLYYGEAKNGPSKMKAFIDGLRGQGLLDEFNPDNPEIDSDWFVGIEQRVGLSVKGNFNNVTAVGPLRTPKKAQAAPAAPAPAPKRNAPQKATSANTRPAPTAEDDGSELFDD